jgi:putative transcriptional regulator
MPSPPERRRLAVVLCALAALAGASATLLRPAAPPAARASVLAQSSLAGRLLVATEALRDPRFSRTVVYMIRHDATGAMGLIVNRPVRELPLAPLLRQWGLDDRGVTGTVLAHYGGPVELRLGFVLHTAEYATPDTQRVTGDIALTAEPAVPGVLADIARGAGPRKALFLLGYAGWAPGQLEGEIDLGSWITVPADPALLFDEDHARKWERAAARRLTI